MACVLIETKLLLMQWDNTGEDCSHLYCANVLCDKAITLAIAKEYNKNSTNNQTFKLV